MFYAPGLVFGENEGAGSRFQVLCSRSYFPRYRERKVPFSSFARPYTFSAVSRASARIFIFCAPGLVFGSTEGVGSHFQNLRAWNLFRRYRGRSVPFSYFAIPDMFFCGAECVGSRFVLPNSFSAVPRASSPEGDGSYFHVLRGRTSFWRYRGRRFPFLSFALLDTFFAVPRASGLIFMFCALGLIFGCTEGVGSRFHILCSRTRFRVYRGCQLPFSCFARLDSFSAVPRASGPVFKFYTPGLVFGGTTFVGSRFDVLCSQTHFWRYRGRQVLFSYFARPDSFSTVPKSSALVFKFCAPGLVFGSNVGLKSRFHVLRVRTRFRRYRGRRVPFSSFARPNSFLAVPRASCPFSCFALPDMFFTVPSASGPVLCVRTHFHTRFA
jgi:hypothetical protein